MTMTNEQVWQLSDALLDAFDLNSFERVLRTRIGLRLALVTPSHSPLLNQVFDVIQMAERQGWLPELVRAAFEARPDRDDLRTLYRELGLDTRIVIPTAGAAFATGYLSTGEEIRQLVSKHSLDFATWQRGLAAVQHQVCRVEVGGRFVGTGFLVGADLILTCHHVVADVAEGRMPPTAVVCLFDLPQGAPRTARETAVALSAQRWSAHHSPEPAPGDVDRKKHLDYALLRLARSLGDRPLDPDAGTGPTRGWVQVPGATPELPKSGPLVIVYFSQDGSLKISLDTEGFLGMAPDEARVRYATPTESGASGAPCFDLGWRLKAMHEGAVPAAAAGGAQANEGIPITLICDDLGKAGLADLLAGGSG